MTTCKDCHEPIYKGADGKWLSEQRKGEPEGGYKGERRRAGDKTPEPPKPPEPPRPPKREHRLNRPLFGGKP